MPLEIRATLHSVAAEVRDGPTVKPIVIDLTRDDDELQISTLKEPVKVQHKRKATSYVPDSQDQASGPGCESLRKKRKSDGAPRGPAQNYGTQPLTSPVHDSTPLAGPTSSPRPRDDSPLAIYARYVRARSAWYETQLPGARVGRQCREAAGLPLQYGKEEFKWCLDSKQMTERCTTSAGSRDWTKEEMMAYLDWDNAEGERVQLIVDKIGPNFGRNRGMGYIWEMVDEDFHR